VVSEEVVFGGKCYISNMGERSAKSTATYVPQSTKNLLNLIEQQRKEHLAPKALSVTTSLSELEGTLAEGATVSSAPYSQHSFNHDT